MTNYRYNTQPFHVGQQAVFDGYPDATNGVSYDPANLSDRDFHIGSVVRVTALDNRDEDNFCVQIEGDSNYWNVDWFAPHEGTEESTRPTIDFSLPRYETARAYAAAMPSRWT